MKWPMLFDNKRLEIKKLLTSLKTLRLIFKKALVLLFQPDDAQRTIAVNCGYMGTNDYDVEPGDREFLIRVSGDKL